jgi:signal transduction histidine kinase
MGWVRMHWIDVSFANCIAFLIGIGLITTTLWLSAVGASIWQLIRRRGADHLFELAMFIAIVTISFSRLFTLETERIWIFLMPLLIAAAANQLVRLSRSHCRLAIRVAIVLVLLMAQTWVCQLVLNTWW